ncbi:MAG: DNA methylase [Firmicutes bacterium]|nr:DNA methylase [Bacillota bacterium]
MMNFQEQQKLYAQPLPSTRTGLFFNTFPYPTKISPEAIALYIAVHTKPGDTVLDVFGGSGSTGLAALICEHPTEKMLKLAQKLKVSPEWGPRNAVLYEIGKYGSFAAKVICHPPDEQEFQAAAQDFFAKAKNELGWLYQTRSADGHDGFIRHVIWSDLLFCPNCHAEVAYYDLAVERAPMKIKDHGRCPQCLFQQKIEDFPSQLETVYDQLLGQTITRKKRVPVLVYGQTGKGKWVRPVNEVDWSLLQTIEAELKFDRLEPQKINWGDLYRSGYHTGISHLHHFYTKRNFYVMSKLWALTDHYSTKVREALRLVLLSYNAAHSTLMTRVVVKKRSKDFVVTSAQSGVLYISSLPVEKNIIVGTERKLKNFAAVFQYIRQCKGKVRVLNQSSEKLALPDQSIDYIFTDPPFGGFIPYAEVNQINELWLGEPTAQEHEIIISSAQNKNVDTYEKMMTKVFTEMNRVLKDGAQATVIFHSSKTEVWEAFVRSVAAANFVVKETSFLNKTQASFKQVVSKVSVQGDPVILLAKGRPKTADPRAISTLDEAIQSSYERKIKDTRLIYTRYLTSCLEKGVPIEMGAKEAYEYIEQRIGVLTGEQSG